MQNPLEHATDYISLNDAGNFIPNRPHRATVWRWALRGIRRRGETIKLQTITVGARRYTTRANIDQFLAACNGPDLSRPSVVSDTFKRRAEAAGNMLESMGVRTKANETGAAV